MDLLRRLAPGIDWLLSDAGKRRDHLDGVVISLGPGSFTGLRIGMAAAKSIAHVLGKPIVGVPTLDVLAHGASAACPKSVAALTHARPGEVFWALYRCGEAGLKKVVDDRASPVLEVVETAKAENGVVFCGDGAERNRESLEQEFGPSSVLPAWFNSPRGSVLASLGIDRLLRGDCDDVMSIVPRYIRRPTPVIRIEERKQEWL